MKEVKTVSFSAVDANGKLTPEFAAYTKMTVVNRFKSYGGEMGVRTHGNVNKVSFEEFMRAIQSERVMNAGFSRKLPNHEIQHSRVNAQYNGNYQFEHRKMSVIEKAYELGIVGYDGVLLPNFVVKA